MDQLAVVKAHLGIVDIWPSYILRHMFLLEPNSHAMKKVAAFMYGKSVRLCDALSCYNACNGRHLNRLESVLKPSYLAWDREENRTNIQPYYCMSMKCHASINWKAREQYKAVKPIDSVGVF